MNDKKENREENAAKVTVNNADATVGFCILYFCILPLIMYYTYSASSNSDKRYYGPTGVGAGMADLINDVVTSFFTGVICVCIFAVILSVIYPAALKALKWFFFSLLGILIILPALYYLNY